MHVGSLGRLGKLFSTKSFRLTRSRTLLGRQSHARLCIVGVSSLVSREIVMSARRVTPAGKQRVRTGCLTCRRRRRKCKSSSRATLQHLVMLACLLRISSIQMGKTQFADRGARKATSKNLAARIVKLRAFPADMVPTCLLYRSLTLDHNRLMGH